MAGREGRIKFGVDNVINRRTEKSKMCDDVVYVRNKYATSKYLS